MIYRVRAIYKMKDAVKFLNRNYVVDASSEEHAKGKVEKAIKKTLIIKSQQFVHKETIICNGNKRKKIG